MNTSRGATMVLSLLLASSLFASVASAQATLAAGTIVTSTDADMTPVLDSDIDNDATVGAQSALCHIDEDGGSDYDSGELIVFQIDPAADNVCDANTEANDIRLSGTQFGVPIRTVDADFNKPLRSFNAGTAGDCDAAADTADTCLEYYDANGDNVFNVGDTMYVDLVSPASARVDVGDLRLTTYGSHAAMTAVVAGNSDVNLGLKQLTVATADSIEDDGAVHYFDVNGDGAFNQNDVAYINIDGTTANGLTIAVNDIRFTRFSTALGPGTIVGATDTDLTPVLDVDIDNDADAISEGALCHIDEDGGADYDSGELIVFQIDPAADDVCDANTEPNDIRLSGTQSGMPIRTVDADFNKPLRSFSAGTSADCDAAADTADTCLEYYDANGDNVFNVGDTMYADLVSPASARVDVGDLRLTTYGSLAALTPVVAGNSDVNLGLKQLTVATADSMEDTGAVQFFDVNGDGAFNGADVAYVDIDGTAATGATIEVNDIRLTAFSTALGKGTIVGSADADMTPVLDVDIDNDADAVSEGALCHIDEDGGADYDSGELIVFQIDPAADDVCDANTEANDIRLSGTQAGKPIRTVDADFNKPLRSFSAGTSADCDAAADTADTCLEYYDANGDNVFNVGDTMYVDLVSPASARVDVGDLRLTPYGTHAALTAVVAGNSDVNLGLKQLTVATADSMEDTGAMQFFDINGDGAFNGADVAYINIDGTAATGSTVEVNDIRLIAVTGLAAAPVTPPGAAPPGAAPPTTTPPGAAPPPAPPTSAEDLNARITQLVNQLNTSLAQNTQLQGQISQLNAQLSNQTAQLNTLNTRISELQTENANLQEELRRKEGEAQAPGFEAVAVLAALGAALVIARRKL